MPTYHYQARDSSGKIVKGQLEATSRKEASSRLRQQGLQATALDEPNAPQSQEKKEKSYLFSSLKKSEKALKKQTKLKGSEKLALDFFAKLRQLHGSGLPLADAIRTLSQRLADPNLKKLTSDVWYTLSEGQPLSAGLKSHPEIFDTTIISLLEAGESTGNLLPIIDNIIELLTAKLDLRKKVLSGLTYPIFISCVAFGVVGMFIFYLMPKIELMMRSLGGQMTLSARILIGFADLLITQGPWIFIALIIFMVWLVRWRKTPKGRKATDRWLIELPGVKTIAINIELCRAANLMGTLLGSGVNTTESLRLTERAISNVNLLEAFESSRIQINDGASFSSAFRKNPLLTPIALDIISVGENTGSLSSSFRDVYKLHSQELGDQLKFLTGLISSCALAFAFTLVTVLTLGIITSILQLSQQMTNR
jgi:type II secretory pathway component PulF